MAKIQWGTLAAQISGRIGDVIFYTGRFGPGIKLLVVPFQPNTDPQSIIKATTAVLSKRWSNVLTPTDQDNWIAFALAHARPDRFGHLISLTGLQEYMSVNQALAAIGIPSTDTAPLTNAVSDPGTVSISFTPPSGPLTIATTNPCGATDAAAIFATAPQSAGRRAISPKLRQLTYFPVGQIGPYDITADYLTKYAAFPPGRAAAIGVKFTGSTNGAQSPLRSALQFF